MSDLQADRITALWSEAIRVAHQTQESEPHVFAQLLQAQAKADGHPMSDDLTQRAVSLTVQASDCEDCVVVPMSLVQSLERGCADLRAENARLRAKVEEAENARLLAELTALEQEMRKEVEFSAAPAGIVVRWANRIAALRETEQP